MLEKLWKRCYLLFKVMLAFDNTNAFMGKLNFMYCVVLETIQCSI